MNAVPFFPRAQFRGPFSVLLRASPQDGALATTAATCLERRPWIGLPSFPVHSLHSSTPALWDHFPKCAPWIQVPNPGLRLSQGH